MGLALVLGLLLYFIDQLTNDQIHTNSRVAQLHVIDPLMPLQHDNVLYDDTIEISDSGFFGPDHTVSVFRARQNGQPVGAVLMPVEARGYSGTIELIIGIAYDGTLLGVRALHHRETPGLGDGIDHEKSSWIAGFTGRSLQNLPAESWMVTEDGGTIDQLSGATITSRGVVNAVRKALEYYSLQRDRLY